MRREIGSTTSTGAPALAASRTRSSSRSRAPSASSFAVNAASRPARARGAGSAVSVPARRRARRRRAAGASSAPRPRPSRSCPRPRRSPAAAARAPRRRPRCRCRSRGRGSAAARLERERAHDLAHQQEVQRPVVERERRALAAALERLAERDPLAPLDVERRERLERAADLGEAELGEVARLERGVVRGEGVGRLRSRRAERPGSGAGPLDGARDLVELRRVELQARPRRSSRPPARGCARRRSRR